MVQTAHSADQRRVLEALADLEDAGRVQTVHAVAIATGLDMPVVGAIVNELFTAGDLTPSLTLTPQGRAAVGR